MYTHTHTHTTCAHTALEVLTLKETEQEDINKLEGRMGFTGAYVQYPPTGCVCVGDLITKYCFGNQGVSGFPQVYRGANP